MDYSLVPRGYEGWGKRKGNVIWLLSACVVLNCGKEEGGDGGQRG